MTGELPIVPKLKRLPSLVRDDGPQPSNWSRYQVDLAGRDFDDRLKYLEPYLEPMGTRVPTQAYWRLTTVRWADRDRLKRGEVRNFVGHSDMVRKIAFSPTRQLLASTSADKTVRLWSLD